MGRVKLECGEHNVMKHVVVVGVVFGGDRDTVFMLAGLLGHGEDFDGLIVELEDYDRNTNNS